jgi:PPOX class probable F420-dependent enzyme
MSSPTTELDPRYSQPEATAASWDAAAEALAAAELSWLTTVRPDGRPHVTPLITVMREGRLYFCTGPGERKARNLAANPAVVLTTGTNDLHGGTDYVVEGVAERVTGRAELRELADAWVQKYGEEWRFEVGEDAFRHADGEGHAHVYAVRATQAFGFGKAPYSQTRWRFSG